MKEKVDPRLKIDPKKASFYQALTGPNEGKKDKNLDRDMFFKMVDIGISLATSESKEELIQKIVMESQIFSHADMAVLYLLPMYSQKAVLEYALLDNQSLGIKMGTFAGQNSGLPTISLINSETNQPNHKNLAAHVALTGKTKNIHDSYDDGAGFDFSDFKMFDERNDYESKSFLTVPMINPQHNVVGVLQLVNMKIQGKEDTFKYFSAKIEPVIEALAAFAAVALDNQMLIQGHKDLLDAFVKCIAHAVDVKSSHTSAHCQRVPELTEMIAQAACEEESGPFGEFQLSEGEKYELHVAAWMHDCGKLATPDHILNKSTKLYTLGDGIGEVKARFELIKRDLEIQYLKESNMNPENNIDLKNSYNLAVASLEDDYKFLEELNKGGESVTFESQERVRKIANYRYENMQGESKPLLTSDEVERFIIQRGTLTQEEKKIMNNHIVVTIDMLESLPFPRHLRRVPEIAGGHHEKMDGTGFPKGLKREELSILARMMGVADVFEALTAKERPYKVPMKLSQALSILKDMKNRHHIDKEIFNLFLNSGVWKKYADMHLEKDQLDVIEVSQYL